MWHTVAVTAMLALACSPAAWGQIAQNQFDVTYDFTRRGYAVPKELSEAELVFQAVLRDSLKAHGISEAPINRWPDYRIEIRVRCMTDACPQDAAVAISIAMVREYRVADKLADYLFARQGRVTIGDSLLVALALDTPTLGDRLWFTWTALAQRSEVRQAAAYIAVPLRVRMRPSISNDSVLNSQAEALLRKWK